MSTRTFSLGVGALAGLLAIASVACDSTAVGGPDGGAGASGSGAAGATGGGSGTGAAGTSAVGTGAAGTGVAGTGAAGTGGAGDTSGVPANVGASNSALCPATFDGLATHASCPFVSGHEAGCAYAEGLCACVLCDVPSSDVSGRHWECRRWDTAGDGCPAYPPNLGTPCTKPGQNCAYGSICGVNLGDSVTCMNQSWTKVPSPLGTCALPTCGTH